MLRSKFPASPAVRFCKFISIINLQGASKCSNLYSIPFIFTTVANIKPVLKATQHARRFPELGENDKEESQESVRALVNGVRGTGQCMLGIQYSLCSRQKRKIKECQKT